MLTTTDDPREVERCYELGCSVYLTKPVEYEGFIEAINRLGLFLQVVKVPRNGGSTLNRPASVAGPVNRRETVLVIEDDPGVARLESPAPAPRRLRRRRPPSTTAEDGLDAILARGGVDLIILDHEPPGGEVSGLDLYEQLRAEGRHSRRRSS